VGLVVGVGMAVKAVMAVIVAIMQRVDLHMVMLIYLVNLAVAAAMSVHLQRLVVV